MNADLDSETWKYRLNEPAVVVEVFDDETIILNLESGAYYTLNASAGELWRLTIGGLTRSEVLSAIAQKFGVVPLDADVDGFIARLIEYHLIVLSQTPVTEPTGDEPALTTSWGTPEIIAYGDMKDLVAMDPPLPPMRPVVP